MTAQCFIKSEDDEVFYTVIHTHIQTLMMESYTVVTSALRQIDRREAAIMFVPPETHRPQRAGKVLNPFFTVTGLLIYAFFLDVEFCKLVSCNAYNIQINFKPKINISMSWLGTRGGEFAWLTV